MQPVLGVKQRKMYPDEITQIQKKYLQIKRLGQKKIHEILSYFKYSCQFYKSHATNAVCYFQQPWKHIPKYFKQENTLLLLNALLSDKPELLESSIKELAGTS